MPSRWPAGCARAVAAEGKVGLGPSKPHRPAAPCRVAVACDCTCAGRLCATATANDSSATATYVCVQTRRLRSASTISQATVAMLLCLGGARRTPSHPSTSMRLATICPGVKLSETSCACTTLVLSKHCRKWSKSAALAEKRPSGRWRCLPGACVDIEFVARVLFCTRLAAVDPVRPPALLGGELPCRRRAKDGHAA
jgi:hypothetical protein